MLRITSRGAGPGPETAKVEGEIAGDHVDELARFVAAALENTPRIVLDLTDVTFVDHGGARLLRALRARGVELVGGSSFVSSLVNGPSVYVRAGEQR